MRIAITGAYSYSGKYVARRLLDRGADVITLTGHPGRPDPFEGRVPAFALDFENPDQLTANLSKADVLVNTYWIRFDRGANTQAAAVENTRRLIDAARRAGVRRVIHISITNPSESSALPYFRGKARNERTVMDSGMSYAILRPTVLFGKEDILINNIAFFLRRFPLFLIPASGSYRLQPVYVDDLAGMAADAVYRWDSYVQDAVGPEIVTFRELLQLIGRKIGRQRPLIALPPTLVLAAARLLGVFFGDVVLTPYEIDGLMADLLVSSAPPLGRTRLSDWIEQNRDSVGRRYASEVDRHYI
jgi:NADH dehydrogenase